MSGETIDSSSKSALRSISFVFRTSNALSASMNANALAAAPFLQHPIFHSGEFDDEQLPAMRPA